MKVSENMKKKKKFEEGFEPDKCSVLSRGDTGCILVLCIAPTGSQHEMMLT